MEYEHLIKKAFLIRSFEEKLLALFSEGKVNGTVHTCIGQEWTGVAVANSLKEGDVIFSNHRGHGHFLSYIGDVEGLLSEIMGKKTGICGGVGGSQHLFSQGFYSNGIQGGMVPIAAGNAFAHQRNNDSHISVVFIGDGTLGEGVLYESLNIASKWGVPLLIVLEKNGFAQSTDTQTTIAGTIEGRAKAFGVTYRKSDTWDWKKLISDAEEAVSFVRNHRVPLFFEIQTFRLKAHSKGDDNRPSQLVGKYFARDPLNIMQDSGDSHILEIVEESKNIINKAAENALQQTGHELRTLDDRPLSVLTWEQQSFPGGKIAELINQALAEALTTDSQCLLLGEDIEGPNYGGAFKVTKKLSETFPGKVFNTPISEAAIVGIGTGLSLAGYHPVVEIMFGDFMTLTLDQIFQHACKFFDMYNKKVTVPLVVRTPMGGKRGYGPTHSQSIEKLFIGMPNLRMIALNQRVSPAFLYRIVFNNLSCTYLIIENKILYTRDLKIEKLPGYNTEYSSELFPTLRLSPSKGKAVITILCYGGTLEDVENAVTTVLIDDEIFCEVICPTLISPVCIDPIVDSIERTRKLLIVEEGSTIAAFGSEVLAGLIEKSITIEKVKRIGNDSIIPAAIEAERELLISSEKIVIAIKEIAR
jgi:2-oxoisovalerate dehydrogenase E1 component